MYAEVQLYKKSGTISLSWIKNINSKIRIYTKLSKDNLWFLIFHIAELQHTFSTRIMGPIWMNFGTYMYFFTLIPMVQKFLEFSPSLRYFSHLLDWGQFCRFHSTGCIKQAENLCLGVNLHAKSHDQKTFPKFETFTLSRSKVWNLPFH